jgi:hypothetical protein
MQHGLSNNHYDVVLALNYPILLRVMGCCELSLDALFGRQVLEGFGDVLHVAALIHTCKRELSLAHLVCPWRHNA